MTTSIADAVEQQNYAAQLGIEVKTQLMRHGWSQRKMARAMGVDHTTLYRRCAGDQEFTFEQLIFIAGKLGISLSDLIGDHLLNKKIPVPEDRGVGSTAD